MSNKDTIDTNPSPDAPTATPTNAYSWYLGLTVSNYPYSLRNHNFLISSTNTPKPSKKIKKKKGDKVNSYNPPNPNNFYNVLPKTFAWSPGSTSPNCPY